MTDIYLLGLCFLTEYFFFFFVCELFLESITLNLILSGKENRACVSLGEGKGSSSNSQLES